MNSYDILNVTKDSSDKEIEVAYMDLKRKYDPSFNTSIHAYKKYREIIKAYEDIKNEQRRKMYDLKEDEDDFSFGRIAYKLYDFNGEKKNVIEREVDYSKVEDIGLIGYKDKEIVLEVSYLYLLLNLRYDLEYSHIVKCRDCRTFAICKTCGGAKVVNYSEKVIWCPDCHGEGKVSCNCKTCGDKGYYLVNDNLSFYIDSEIKDFKGLGDEYSNNLKSNLKVKFNFYDKENITVKDDIIKIDYYLNKEETFRGIDREYFSEIGAFKLKVNSFVDNGHKQEIYFNNKTIIFTFYNEKYNGENKLYYLFINKKFKNKFIYFNDDYSKCSAEETVECSKLVKCDSKIILENYGYNGKYGGDNGNLVINVEFNNKDDLIYTDNIKIFKTSKMFNLLGGSIGDFYHYGFKAPNSLIQKNNTYYLLEGKSDKKDKLKNYFLFKFLSIVTWIMIPLLMILMPYTETMFSVLAFVLFGHLLLINMLMELEV
jgi:DnaJ-class molecular chaperone